MTFSIQDLLAKETEGESADNIVDEEMKATEKVSSCFKCVYFILLYYLNSYTTSFVLWDKKSTNYTSR